MYDWRQKFERAVLNVYNKVMDLTFSDVGRALEYRQEPLTQIELDQIDRMISMLRGKK